MAVRMVGVLATDAEGPAFKIACAHLEKTRWSSSWNGYPAVFRTVKVLRKKSSTSLQLQGCRYKLSL